MSRLLGTCALICACAAVANAQKPTEPIRVRVEAPDDCATVESFVAQLSARASVRVDESASRTFEVTLATYETGGYHGKLVVRASDGDSVRVVDAPTCEEAVAALAVVAALSVNAEPVRVEPVRVPAPPPRIEPGSPARHVAIGGGLGRYWGVVPAAELGIPVFVALGAKDRAQLRLAFAITQEQSTQSSSGSSDFRWTVGRLDARPFALVTGPFVIAGALGIEAGALTARGAMVTRPEDRRRPWVAPYAAARVAFTLDRMALEVEATLATPLIRDRFFIAPSTTVHQAPVITGGVAVAASVELF